MNKNDIKNESSFMLYRTPQKVEQNLSINT